MNIRLSQRCGRAFQSSVIQELDADRRWRIAMEICRARSFSDLSRSTQKLIRDAEAQQ